jgi:hypothetical protein
VYPETWMSVEYRVSMEVFKKAVIVIFLSLSPPTYTQFSQFHNSGALVFIFWSESYSSTPSINMN